MKDTVFVRLECVNGMLKKDCIVQCLETSKKLDVPVVFTIESETLYAFPDTNAEELYKEYQHAVTYGHPFGCAKRIGI